MSVDKHQLLDFLIAVADTLCTSDVATNSVVRHTWIKLFGEHSITNETWLEDEPLYRAALRRVPAWNTDPQNTGPLSREERLHYAHTAIAKLKAEL